MKAGNSNLEVGQKVQLCLDPTDTNYRLFNGCVGLITHPFSRGVNSLVDRLPHTGTSCPDGWVGFYDPEDVLGLDHINVHQSECVPMGDEDITTESLIELITNKLEGSDVETLQRYAGEMDIKVKYIEDGFFQRYVD